MSGHIFSLEKYRQRYQSTISLLLVALLASVQILQTDVTALFKNWRFNPLTAAVSTTMQTNSAQHSNALADSARAEQLDSATMRGQQFNNLALNATNALSGTSDLVINEFMASNVTIADEDGTFQDWVELYNRGTSPISLLGIGLSDTIATPFRWTFPEITLAPGEYLLVWASGKNRTNPAAPLHTNFSISAGGEPLLLTHPVDGTLYQVAPLRMPSGLTYGHSPDGSDNWYFFDKPTPGSSNIHTGYTEALAPPSFSQNGGFYTQEFDVNIASQDAGATIYYTLDGSIPDPQNLNGQTYSYKQNYPQYPNSPFGQLYTDTFQSFVYTGSLHIHDRLLDPDQFTGRASTWEETPNRYIPTSPVFKGTIIRARAFKQGALPSPVVTHSYFVTPEGAQRYTLPVISLGIQEDHLYDYNRGIYVPGETFDNWRLQNPTAIAHAGVLGNYSGSTEYPSSLEIFTNSGGRVLAQNLGFRNHGGQSRAYPQKSMRLYASGAYDSSDTLQYPFFAGLTDRVTGQPITTFQRLILRNSGDDHEKTRLRDAFIQTLMKPLGVDYQAYEPAILFINGEYWGLINIRERQDRYYLGSHYRINPDDVALLENDAELQEGDESDRTDYLALRDYIDQHDMSDPVHYAYAEDRMDMDNFILYNVAEIFSANTDWPHNNILMWRTRIVDTSPTAPPEYDGRWRWLLKDLDFGFGLFPGTDMNNFLWATRITSGREWSTVLLRKLLANPDFRNRFVNATSDHLNTTFQPDHIAALANQLHDRIAPYLPEHAQRWRNTGDTSITPIVEFGNDRGFYVREQLTEFFGLPVPVTMNFNVSDSDHGYLRVNTVKIDHNTPGLPNPAAPYPWQGTYYPNVPIQVTASPNVGYRFVGWLEYPDVLDATITLTPTAGATLTAIFESQTLLHYWDFNNAANMLLPKYSFANGTLTTQLTGDAVVLLSSGQGFTGTNSYLGSEVGTHLRVNNPLGASLFFALPTTSMRDIVVRYETRRSGQGAGTQKIAYTVDGTTYQQYTTLQIFDADPVVYTLNFSALDAVNNNPHFGIRITFEQGAGGVAGNDRFDNLSMTGSEFKYSLTVNRTGTGSGTVTSTPAAINCGTQCVASFDVGTTQSLTLTAIPQADSSFTGWSGDCSGTELCALSISQSATVTANFEIKSYTVSVTAEPNEGGVVNGGGTFNHGDPVTVTATANDSYSFTGWSENGTTVSTDASYAFTATANRTVVANFGLNQHNITVSADPAAGGTVSGGGTVNHGAIVTVTAVANEGYTFTGWNENGTTVSVDASYAFAATANRTLVANFSLNQHNITVSANPAAGGTVSGGGTVNHGATVTVTAAANEGYTFTGWSENSATVSTNASYAFTATANRTLVANFSLNQYNVTVSANPAAGGTVSGGGTVNHGATVTVTAIANSNFGFAGWSENGSSVSADESYVFVATNHRNLVANFVTDPMAVNDAAATVATSSVQISVLENDIDPAGGGLHIVELTQPAHGTVVTDVLTSANGGQVIYTPDSAFSGSDSFNYTVQDIHGFRSSATVSVIVANPANGEGTPQLRIIDNGKDHVLSFGGITLTVPSGSYSGTLRATDVFYIVFTELISPTAHISTTPESGYQYAGRSFILQAHVNNTELLGDGFPAPLTISVQYDPNDIAGLDENTISLYFWNVEEGEWSKAGISRVSIDTTNHIVTYQVDHFTEFAIFANKPVVQPSDHQTWLPLITK